MLAELGDRPGSVWVSPLVHISWTQFGRVFEYPKTKKKPHSLVHLGFSIITPT